MGICEIDRPKKVPDLSYDFLVKSEQQKDGLDVYKPREIITFYEQIKCPLCKIKFTEEEYSIISDKLNTASEKHLQKLISDYNTEASRIDILDNINTLESIYNLIQNCSKNIKANRYYKHTCTNNEICKRMNNQEIYIDLCINSDIDNFDNRLFIDPNRLKDDENYRNKYINDKRDEHIKYMRKRRKAEIENKYRPQFEEYCFQKEIYDFEKVKMMIEAVHKKTEPENPYLNNPHLLQFPSGPDPSQIYWSNESNFQYSATKKKLKEFAEDYTGKIMYDNPIMMHDWEKEEFKKFILKHEPEYSELLGIE